MKKSSKPRIDAEAVKDAETAPVVSPTIEKRYRVAVLAATVLFIVLAGFFNAICPFKTIVVHGMSFGANPDEQAHYENVGVIAGGHLPVFEAGVSGYEAHQPPLYYALAAPVLLACRSLGDEGDAKAVRWVSTVFGAALIWVCFFAIRDLLPDEPGLALATALFVALLPMNVSLCASVSNDSLTNLVTALGLWQIGRLAIRGEEYIRAGSWTRQCLLLGLIMGIGIWTKTSTLLLFPVAVLALGMLAVKSAQLRAKFAAGAAISVVVGVLIGLPWLIRNTMLYGDPVAQHLFMTAFANTAQVHAVAAANHMSFADWFEIKTIPWTFYSFWGFFVSMQYPLPQNLYLVLLGFSVVSLGGAVFWLLNRSVSLDLGRKVVVGSYILMVLLTTAAFVRFNLIFFQAQGRYFYTALLPIAFFFCVGLRQIEPKAYKYFFVGLSLAVLALVDICAIYLLARLFSQMAAA